MTSSSETLTIVDVGASGGIEAEWLPRKHDAVFVLLEPNPQTAASLRESTADFAHCSVVEAGLYDQDGTFTLNLTRADACSSLLSPNRHILRRYSVDPIFDVVSTVNVECHRYDTLFKAGRVPVPDYLKIDTQGTELNILRGFGDILLSCLAVRLEAHFYPIYEGQPLIGDVVAFMDTFDLALREVIPCRSFDEEYVEVDCIFTRRSPRKDQEAKLSLIEETLGLKRYDLGRWLRSQVMSEPFKERPGAVR